jgi:hypothetical protein
MLLLLWQVQQLSPSYKSHHYRAYPFSISYCLYYYTTSPRSCSDEHGERHL